MAVSYTHLVLVIPAIYVATRDDGRPLSPPAANQALAETPATVGEV